MVRSSFEIAGNNDHDEYWDGDFHDEDEEEAGDEGEGDDEAFDGRPARAAPVSLNGHSPVASEHVKKGGLNGGHHSSTGRKNKNNNNNNNNNRKARMKKMKVTTQRDYVGPTVNIQMLNMFLWEPRTRGVCCLGSIAFAIILLFISWIVPKGELSTRHHASTTLAPVSDCHVQTPGATFSNWMHSIKITNSSHLCRSEVIFFTALL
jgi:hypothetical protein